MSLEEKPRTRFAVRDNRRVFVCFLDVESVTDQGIDFQKHLTALTGDLEGSFDGAFSLPHYFSCAVLHLPALFHRLNSIRYSRGQVRRGRA